MLAEAAESRSNTMKRSESYFTNTPRWDRPLFTVAMDFSPAGWNYSNAIEGIDEEAKPSKGPVVEANS